MPRLIRNKEGGINDMEKGALSRATSKAIDLITFPKGIDGTNCFNCKFIRDKEKDLGYCSNKSVLQYVNGRMCCNLWGRTGTYRPKEK